ncbi:TlpA family protein disulfide reductase [Pedobacter punctiformis]|uniref:TlpA disulfide reductase family protein n=1 Tax=Pedobacter punctiformis TaxID=3004097 RepID=A0ABT4L751_9SPHI|nr:TlpA disulfide reductase family protein [Pedobacter sp. HCMS5-2]MCZ4243744.1 TlpA disulfide reductase family protein [Pedobacter sp. HCMS5-2]
MLKNLLLIALFFSVSFVNAQQGSLKKTTLNEQSVVRGEDGMVYPYTVWKKLMSTGKYGLKNRGTVTESGKPEYVVYELTPEKKAAYVNQMPRPRSSDSFPEGELFNGLKVTDMNGNKYDLRDSTGKVIVLNFWFINCPPCKNEIPLLNELVTTYKDKNVVFLAIALDEKHDLKDFLKTTSFNYNIVDGGRYIANKYGVKGYPTHVVIDKSGFIKFSTLGLAINTVHWLEKSINEALASK